MKIAYLSTYNQVCGIADYTASLVKHIPAEHEVKIIAPKLTGVHHSVRPVGPEDSRVHRLFNATIWDGIVSVDVDEIVKIAEWADVFHIQYQDALYHHEWFYPVIDRLRGKTKLYVTLHDNCLGKIYPMFPMFNKVLTMKPEVKSQVPQAELIGMPIYENKPVIKGFGLGRSKHDNIKRICDELGYIYEYVKAEDKWMPIKELMTWLRDSDGIVLYYDEVGTAGSSAGARTALSTRRPVFLNRVTWFNDIPEDVVTKFNDDEDLKTKLYEKFNNEYIHQNSFEAIAQRHIDIYQQT